MADRSNQPRPAVDRPRSIEHAHLPPDQRRVMDAFVVDGRLTRVPARHAKRLVVLDWLAQSFEPGRRYTEREVNETLAARHPDVATLRRHLVEEEMLSREAGEYWRSGGTTS